MNVIPHPQVLGNCTIFYLYKKYLATLGRLGSEILLSFLSFRQCYNKDMGLFSRFNSGNTNPPLHSSGIAGDDAMGAASPQSFQQCKAIEQNRKHVGSYRDAGVLHSYKHSAYQQTKRIADISQPTVNSRAVGQHERSSTIARTSRIENRQTSRIDNVKTSRRDFSSGGSAFREPQPRRHNPYS